MSSDNRHTKVDMLAGLAQLSRQIPEASAVLPTLSSSLVGDTPESASKKLVSKRSCSPKDDTEYASSGKIAKLPSISESKPSSFTNARNESPWEIYKKHFDLDLNGPVTVAQGKTGLVAVRTFTVAGAEKALYMHGQVRHSNIVEAIEAFTTETSFYIVLEYMPISLYQIVESAKYPTESELAAILRQVSHTISCVGHTLTRSTEGPRWLNLSRNRGARTWIYQLPEHPPQHQGRC